MKNMKRKILNIQDVKRRQREKHVHLKVNICPY
jgi:hypothetical protein